MNHAQFWQGLRDAEGMAHVAEDVYSLNSVLTRQECKDLIARGEQLGFESSLLCTSCVPTRVGVRNNSRVEFYDRALAETLWQRCENSLPTQFRNEEVCGFHEAFRFYRYDGDQFFKPHTDNRIELNDHLGTRFTCLFYLNDDFSEGETVFYLEKKFEGHQDPYLVVVPRQGAALVFRHDWWHEGRAPIGSRKYVLRTDLLFRKLSLSAE